MSTVSTSTRQYHHGDLRDALVAAAVQVLESGEPYSLRGVARRAGVSAAAPYRHFADRTALDSAVSAEGFRELRTVLAEAWSRTLDGEDRVETISRLAVAYVDFALRRPALFRLMFGGECDDAESDRVLAAQALHAFIGEALGELFPDADLPALATGLWGMAHGLAFLHLDGKYRPEPAEEVAKRVRAAATAVLATHELHDALAAPGREDRSPNRRRIENQS